MFTKVPDAVSCRCLRSLPLPWIAPPLLDWTRATTGSEGGWKIRNPKSEI
jgi:hypothetical protein